jgi:hypothetical protein
MSANYFGLLFPPQPVVFGSFSSTQTQVLTQDVVLPFTYDTVDIPPVGISQKDATIEIKRNGVYKVLSSLQCNKTSGGVGDMEMWITINKTNVPNTATRIQINQNIESLMTVEWFVSLKKGDELEVVGFSTSDGLEALAIAEESPVPTIPSIITTILRIG